MTNGRPASIPWSGARSPVSRQAWARACARAAWIARNAVAASCASRSTVRDTVGSDATGPNRPGSVRSTAMSARQSPPTASVTARSSTTFAGSCTACGDRHGASAPDSAWSRPTARTVPVNGTAPACDTTAAVAVSVFGHG